MQSDLTNLLPASRKRAIARDYVMRVATVGCFLLAFLVIVHGLLLVPSYFYLSQQVRAREAELASVEAAAADTGEGEVRARLALLAANAQRLVDGSARPTAAGAIRAMLAVPRDGVRMSGITFAPSNKADTSRMTLTGVATTRETLRAYVQALDALPYVDRAELPISAYAKEKDIEFTVTLVGSLVP